MNWAQIVVRALGVSALILMIVFPPWKASFTEGPDNTPGAESLGYRPLWFRLELAEDDPRTNVQQRINLLRLALQLGGVLVFTNIGLFLARASRPGQRRS